MNTLATELARHVPRMYRIALRMVGRPEAARDIAQEACLKALRSADQFNGQSTWATWLHRITVNCARDHLRKHRQRDRGQTDWDNDTLGTLPLLEATPAERAEKTDLYRLALKLIAQLPEECRSAFMLTQLDGYSYDEAATIEDVSRGTVASRVHRARKILLEQMNDHLGGEMP